MRLPLASKAMPRDGGADARAPSPRPVASNRCSCCRPRQAMQAAPCVDAHATCSTHLRAEFGELATRAVGRGRTDACRRRRRSRSRRRRIGAKASTAPSCAATLLPVLVADASSGRTRAVAQAKMRGAPSGRSGRRRTRREIAARPGDRAGARAVVAHRARSAPGSPRSRAAAAGRFRLRPMNTRRLARGSPSFQGADEVAVGDHVHAPGRRSGGSSFGVEDAFGAQDVRALRPEQRADPGKELLRIDRRARPRSCIATDESRSLCSWSCRRRRGNPGRSRQDACRRSKAPRSSTCVDRHARALRCGGSRR